MEEREINLVDLLTDILSHWRGVLVCMLIGALLMGGFSYLKSYKKAGTVQNEPVFRDDKGKSSEELLEELGQQLSDTEKTAVYAVLDDEYEYALLQQYMDCSVVMQMDPYHIPRTDMIYKIHVDDMGQSYMLRSVYEDLINGIGLRQWIEEQTGISSAITGELISAQAKSNIMVLNGVQDTELGNDCLRVVITHSDEAECERLAQCVKDYIDRQYEKLSQELGTHEVVLLSESTGIVMDTGIRDRQLSYSNNQITLLTNCAKVKDAFSEDQQRYYALLKEEDVLLGSPEGSEAIEEAEPAAQAAASKPSISLKYVFLGAVLFAFMYVGVFFVLYILNNKLRATDELQSLYNISQLGFIVKDEEKKKFFIDRWIDTLRNRNKRRFTAEQSLELAAAAIKISAAKHGLGTVYLMGCNLKAGADVVCQELEERLRKEKISVRILDNVLYDAVSMEELESANGIVLVEKAMSTMYSEIVRELELASRQGITILGGIVVE